MNIIKDNEPIKVTFKVMTRYFNFTFLINIISYYH